VASERKETFYSVFQDDAFEVHRQVEIGKGKDRAAEKYGGGGGGGIEREGLR